MDLHFLIRLEPIVHHQVDAENVRTVPARVHHDTDEATVALSPG
jgi:hypothetical protein